MHLGQVIELRLTVIWRKSDDVTPAGLTVPGQGKFGLRERHVTPSYAKTEATRLAPAPSDHFKPRNNLDCDKPRGDLVETWTGESASSFVTPGGALLAGKEASIGCR
jgi:hypothetical protein